ncbi:MAG: hypothetical protein IKS52_11080 [Clostridia bacterium]|nr:hypothetical protein [Clostridia bacterium]
MGEKTCRKCLLREAYPDDYEKYVASVLKTMAPSERADERMYDARLNVCRGCGRLSNATCMACGCLVEIRAAQRRMRCPFGKWVE